jgi:hypothetical protein
MKVKSRFDVDEEHVKNPTEQYLRGHCGVPYNLGMGPGRMDVSELHPPSFIETVFKTLGWKTRSREPSDCAK